MTIIQAILLGLIQGLTEFLPISSSGHLVLMQNFLGITEGSLTFDILVHFGTLVAVFYVFRKDIISLIVHPFQKMNLLIIAGAVPTAIIGFIIKPYFEEYFSSVYIVGISLIITGFILWFAEQNIYIESKNERNANILDALIIGIAQGLAITPGISRSGITISTGLIRGFNKELAARYSFLLSIPVILGANILEFYDLFKNGFVIENVPAYIIGPLVAAISGIFAIKILLDLLNKGKLRLFSYYVWILGTFVLIIEFI